MTGINVYGTKNAKLMVSFLLLLGMVNTIPAIAQDDAKQLEIWQRRYNEYFLADYSKFWADTGIKQFYSYGTPCDLSGIYEFLSEVELANPRFPNPMKNMVMVDGLGYWATSWDYLDKLQNPGPGPDSRLRHVSYCTDFTAALILLRFLSYKEAVEIVESNPELLTRWQALWDRFSGPGICLLVGDVKHYSHGIYEFPLKFMEQNHDEILIRAIKLQNLESYIRAWHYSQITPLTIPHQGYLDFLRYKPFFEYEGLVDEFGRTIAEYSNADEKPQDKT